MLSLLALSLLFGQASEALTVDVVLVPQTDACSPVGYVHGGDCPPMSLADVGEMISESDPPRMKTTIRHGRLDVRPLLAALDASMRARSRRSIVMVMDFGGRQRGPFSVSANGTGGEEMICFDDSASLRHYICHARADRFLPANGTRFILTAGQRQWAFSVR